MTTYTWAERAPVHLGTEGYTVEAVGGGSAIPVPASLSWVLHALDTGVGVIDSRPAGSPASPLHALMGGLLDRGLVAPVEDERPLRGCRIALLAPEPLAALLAALLELLGAAAARWGDAAEAGILVHAHRLSLPLAAAAQALALPVVAAVVSPGGSTVHPAPRGAVTACPACAELRLGREVERAERTAPTRAVLAESSVARDVLVAGLIVGELHAALLGQEPGAPWMVTPQGCVRTGRPERGEAREPDCPLCALRQPGSSAGDRGRA